MVRVRGVYVSQAGYYKGGRGRGRERKHGREGEEGRGAAGVPGWSGRSNISLSGVTAAATSR